MKPTKRRVIPGTVPAHRDNATRTRCIAIVTIAAVSASFAGPRVRAAVARPGVPVSRLRRPAAPPANAMAAILAAADPKPSEKRPALYDTNADGGRQIAAALAAAKRDNKRVLLQFGANWCVWCHRLHELFASDRDIARTLLYEYVLVLIDVDTVGGKKHNADIDARYGHPTRHGLPVLVVLDADGTHVTTQETGALEAGDHHNPEKVLAFLKKWRPEPVSADAALRQGLATARAESKNVFLFFAAPWCGWCHKLDAYLRRPDIAPVFGKGFVTVKIDVDRMTGGKDVDKRYRRHDGGGIPIFVVLDPAGQRLADSWSPRGNVGFPVEPHEVEHFMTVVKATAPKLSSADLSALRRGLSATPARDGH
ncbi:MAG: thioredoxin family protein [Phycisphaerae bacterium]